MYTITFRTCTLYLWSSRARCVRRDQDSTIDDNGVPQRVDITYVAVLDPGQIRMKPQIDPIQIERSNPNVDDVDDNLMRDSQLRRYTLITFSWGILS